MAEITKNGVNSGRGGWSFWPLLLALLAVVNAILGLNTAFLGPDEPRYAEVGREMFERSDWVTPTLGGFPWFEKPPLVYWFEILFYRIFGVNEFAARLGPALCGAASIACLWIFGKIVVRSNDNLDPSLPNWLALIAASTVGLIAFSHGISFDLVVTFTITASLVGYFAFDQQPGEARKRKYGSLFAFYFFIGAGLLAKGLIGVVFPVTMVVLFHLIRWRPPRKGFFVSLIWGLPLTMAVAATWYWPMYQRHGWRFIDEFIIQQHFQRFASNKYQHPQPFYFFLIVLPLMTVPWLPVFIAAAWRSIREIFIKVGDGDEPTGRRDTIVLAWIWVLVPLVFFSLSGSKLPGYVLPSLPPAIILTGLFLAKQIERSRLWGHAAITTAMATFLVSIGLIVYFGPRYAPTDTAKFLIDAANDRGYTDERVTGILVVSHSGEFYAAGRLLRTPEGTQEQFYCIQDLVAEMRASEMKRILVFVPNERLREVVDSPAAHTELISTSGDLSIILLSLE